MVRVDGYRRLARRYNEWAKTQAAVAERLMQVLAPRLSEAPGSVLELGCGTGQFTALLARVKPWRSYRAIDRSAAMISVAEAALSPLVQFHADDITTFDPAGDWNWVVSNETLHWMPDPFAAIERIRALMPSRPSWAMSVSVAGTYVELKEAFSSLGLTPQLPATAFLPADTWDAELRRRFSSVDTRFWTIQEPFPTIMTLLRAAQASMGASASPIHLSRRSVDAIESEIRRKHGRLLLTSQVMVAICDS